MEREFEEMYRKIQELNAGRANFDPEYDSIIKGYIEQQFNFVKEALRDGASKEDVSRAIDYCIQQNCPKLLEHVLHEIQDKTLSEEQLKTIYNETTSRLLYARTIENTTDDRYVLNNYNLERIRYLPDKVAEFYVNFIDKVDACEKTYYEILDKLEEGYSPDAIMYAYDIPQDFASRDEEISLDDMYNRIDDYEPSKFNWEDYEEEYEKWEDECDYWFEIHDDILKKLDSYEKEQNITNGVSDASSKISKIELQYDNLSPEAIKRAVDFVTSSDKFEENCPDLDKESIKIDYDKDSGETTVSINIRCAEEDIGEEEKAELDAFTEEIDNKIQEIQQNKDK